MRQVGVLVALIQIFWLSVKYLIATQLRYHYFYYALYNNNAEKTKTFLWCLTLAYHVVIGFLSRRVFRLYFLFHNESIAMYTIINVRTANRVNTSLQLASALRAATAPLPAVATLPAQPQLTSPVITALCRVSECPPGPCLSSLWHPFQTLHHTAGNPWTSTQGSRLMYASTPSHVGGDTGLTVGRYMFISFRWKHVRYAPFFV